MAHERHQNRCEDCTGEGPMMHEREQQRLDDRQGPGPQMMEPEQERFEDRPDDAGDGATAEQPSPTEDGANLRLQYGKADGPGKG